jgi:hypothetical protein
MQIKTFLCMTLLSLCATAATSQETFTDGDFTFTVNDENAATRTAYTGSDGGRICRTDRCATGVVEISGTHYKTVVQ